MKIIHFIPSGEFLFAAFLLANVFKSALPAMPVDLNIILFLLTTFIAVKRLSFRPEITKLISLPASLFTIFVGYALFTYLYSPSEIYGFQKIALLFTFSLWCFIAPFLLLTSIKSLKRFLASFALIVVSVSVYGLNSYAPEASIVERFGIEGANTIGLGRAAALGSIILILMYIFNTNISRLKRLVSFFLFVVLLLTLFLTGSRMALISLLVTLLIYLTVKTISIENSKVYINKSSLKVASSLLVIPIILIPFRGYLELMFTRLINLFNSSGFGSYTQRTELYTLAINTWNDNLFNLIFGNGIGSYTIFFDGIDERYYPHNILLEILSELGIVGLLVFITLIIVPFIIHNQFESNYLQVIVMLMFVYTFLNANTTGDINDNRMMFTFLALMYMYPLFNRLQDKTEDKSITEL